MMSDTRRAVRVASLNVSERLRSKILPVLAIAGLGCACGVFSKAEYVRYAQKVTHKSCAEGDAVFASEIEPVVDSTCGTSRCHAKAGHSFPLVTGEGENNLASFRSHVLDDPDGFYTYISGTTHAGGKQDGNLKRPAFQKWVDAEVSCK